MHYLAAAISGEARVLLTLFIMLLAAKLMAELFERLRQPAVAGEILAGVIIGPSLLALAAPSEITDLLAEIGVIFLLFTVGLETKPAAIFKVGKRAAIVAVLGVVAPLLCGWLLMRAWGSSGIEALFVGTAMVATSVGITARVLSGMGLLDAPTARIILGAAVIDDILGLLILSMVSSMAAGSVNYLEILITAALAIGFTAFIALVGAPVVTRVAPRVEQLRSGEGIFIFGLVLCLGLSVAATYIGVAAIIGAFLAGMALAEGAEDAPKMHSQMSGVTEFLVPFFLVNIGMKLSLEVFRSPSVIMLCALVTLIAIATKLLGCGLGALNLGVRRAAQIGMGMVPRGEVGIIVAQIGLSLAVIGPEIYGVVLFMAVATTVIAPPFLKLLYANEAAAHDEIGPPDAGGIVTAKDLAKIA
ncbi:MAG: cation:proton antiporter [Acidobacteria bacterium]|nr:cation:proton antiporter [Acidobacteriota bacterium]MCA1627972.1 cation:proton antiporter [Acidobacteriota bacterium]